MRKRMLWLAVTGLLLCWGCSDSATKSADEFSIKGTVRGLEGKSLHLERITPTKSEPVQVIELDDEGRFEAVAKGVANAIFQLRSDDGRRLLFFPEFDALEIEADADEMEAYQVSGSAPAKALRDFNMRQYRLYVDYGSAEAQLKGIDRFADSLRWRELEGVTDRALIAYWGFLRQYCDTVGRPIFRAHAAMSLAPTGNYYFLDRLQARIERELPGSEYAVQVRTVLQQEAAGRIGVVAPPLAGTTLDGKPFDITGLRGKRAMVVFWASYCEYSRHEFERLATMRPVFEAANVPLVCVSIDDSEADWRKFLQGKGLDWATHIRTRTGQGSEEIRQYKVRAIPSTYLIGPDGMIETIDMRSDEMEAGLKAQPGAEG